MATTALTLIAFLTGLVSPVTRVRSWLGSAIWTQVKYTLVLLTIRL
jgi:hypothetical protein